MNISLKYRKDFISVDKQTALSAEGEFFQVNDTVKHVSEGEETAVILQFILDEKSNDVVAVTSKGTARICFIYKP